MRSKWYFEAPPGKSVTQIQWMNYGLAREVVMRPRLLLPRLYKFQSDNLKQMCASRQIMS